MSGNPAGRPAAGAAAAEWMNAMREFTTAQLREVVRDAASPRLKIAAARQILQAGGTAKTTAGVPISGAALDRIMDRTAGKPPRAIAIADANGDPIRLDLSRLTEEQIDELERLIVLAANPAQP